MLAQRRKMFAHRQLRRQHGFVYLKRPNRYVLSILNKQPTIACLESWSDCAAVSAQHAAADHAACTGRASAHDK